ncbi:MAG: carboxypeptidase regulatory-like domain-containing protein [Acidobacteriota bacterium]|nr:carboxypeptidase regulatory-like domain-containing protein [Acidobacteriota bacterium]
MKRHLLRSLTVAALLLIPASLAAQITAGRLDGAAQDEQGLVLPGVTVTLESDALLGSRVAVTDVDGSFRFQGLPAGSYTMTFELGGFATVVREDITVITGQTFTVNQTLSVAAVAETVTVTGESPVVDVKSSRFGGTFDDTAILEVPNSTDPHAMLALTPGIRMRGFDVAGSHKAQQSGFDAFGLRNQNRIVIDGVDSNFSTGGFGFYMDSLTVNQFNISNAGADVENAWAGNTIVMDIKTGGNDLSALLYADYLGESFVGDNLTSELENRGAGTNHMLTYWEAHADVGGPLLSDRAWFFLAYNNNLTHRAISGLDPEVIKEEAILRNYYTKVNFALSEKDELIGYSQWGLKNRPNRGINALNSPDVRLAQDSWTWVHKAEWQRVWSDRAFSNVKAMHYGVTWPMVPAVEPDTHPPRVDLDTSRRTGAGVWPFTYDKQRPQFVGILNYYVPDAGGSHDLKFGVDYMEDSRLFFSNNASGSIQYRDRPAGISEILFVNTPTAVSDTRDANLHFFAQDTWQLNPRLTITAGMRVAHQYGWYNGADLAPDYPEFFLSGVSIQEKDIFTWTDFYPRFAVTYDLTGEGRTVVKASVSRYTHNVGPDGFVAANPASRQQVIFQFLDPNGNGTYDGQHELGDLLSQSSGTGLPVGRVEGGVPVDFSKKRYYDEVTASIESEIMPETNLRVSFVRKMDRNVFDTYRVDLLDALLNNAILCGDDIFPCPVNPINGQLVTTLSRPPAGTGTANEVKTGPAGLDANEYDNIEMGLSRRFRSGLFLQGSFHYQWRNELVCCGSSGSADTQADPWTLGIQGSGLNWNSAVSTKQQHTNWNLKAIGRYQIPNIGAAISFQYRAQSGWAYAPILPVVIPGGAGTNQVPLSDMTERSDDVLILDIRAEKDLSFWDRDKLSIFFDAYNVTNSNPVLNQIIRAGSAYNRVIGFLEPRTFKVGARYQF